ncbi:NAD-dependent epimerase/dehydratase family protein [Burkholderia sp. 22PA0099]|uniref:NAD-dependent epimerase/dehydratase family protein n=1 Tax=Burkholderia sp. 22PA0099 TaxID=3237372 RepID=UPI0039C150F4
MEKHLVVLTGASGKIGKRVRQYLKGKCLLRSADIVAMDSPEGDEEVVVCDLTDLDATRKLFAGASVVVHLAGIPREAPIEDIAAANLVATWNVYQAAREAGVKRVIFGSTNHVVGFYRVGERLDADSLARPDTLYGASKVFGEAVARLHWDKHAIESVCLRIGSALERPLNQRQLSTWISYEDLNRLIWASITAERVQYRVVYGISNNSQAWWDNSGANHLGYEPLSRADDFADELVALESVLHPQGDESVSAQFQGGPWAADGYSADQGKVST